MHSSESTVREATLTPDLSPAPTPVLAATELLQWSDETFAHWEKLLEANPTALDLPCDIYKASETVRDLLLHIVAVERRYGERIAGEPVTPYEDFLSGSLANPSANGSANGSIEAIFAVHRLTVEKYRALLADEARISWDEVLEFPTLTAGTMRASRRKILIHAHMHSIRHFAQLATLVRQHGIKPGWPMDFLGSSAMK